MNCRRLGIGILVVKVINPKEVVSERRLAEIVMCRVLRQGRRRDKKKGRSRRGWKNLPFESLTQTFQEVQIYFFFFATFFFAFLATFFLAFFFAMLESPPFKFH
jgi:hypothetical protein